MRAADLLDAAWNNAGYTSPNVDTYPWLWLWDSCFHAVIWAHLDDDRALIELDSLFRRQRPSGFIPHMAYLTEPHASDAYWGVSGSSTITQPPMFGHALRCAAASGMQPSDHALDCARRALWHLVTTRAAGGLLTLAHPWETGCDDSIRWSAWMPDPFSQPRWKSTKTELLQTLSCDEDGMARGNRCFGPASVAFTAIAAFNIAELNTLQPDQELMGLHEMLVNGLEDAWDSSARTWTDGTHASGNAETLEALLPLLVINQPEQASSAWAALLDHHRFRGPFGARQTSATHIQYDPNSYWRGPVWPQLCYLMWLAARRWERDDVAQWLVESTLKGAATSGFAEYWNPETGQGLGAIPQSWTALVVVMAAGGKP